MRHIFKFLILLFIFVFPIFISTNADVKVNGYYRKDGTYVKPHYRSDRDGLKNNNWTTQGNINPHTGEKGSLERNKFEGQIYPNTDTFSDNNNIHSKTTDDTCIKNEDYLCPAEAKNFHDKIIDVCGYVASTRAFSKGYYINFEKNYPNQSLVGVIWSNKVEEAKSGFGFNIESLKGEFICMTGKVGTFNNNIQITGYQSFRIL